ncbi:MAG: hypothetical protein ACYSRQ_00400, partial [Planctomycetota bacterium]
LLMIALSGTKFTEPIELEYTGMRVAIPTGMQWESDEQWRYGNNSFYLTSTLRNPQGKASGSILLRYFFESTSLRIEELLSQKASEFSFEVIRRGSIEKTGFIIQWINMKIPESPYEILYGITKLPSNHLVEIEVQKIEPAFKADEIFEDILKNLQLEDTSVQAGVDTIQEIKDKGAISFLDTIDSPSVFLIMDSRGDPTGFTLDVFLQSQTNESFVFNTESLHYLRQPYSLWESTSYQGDDNISEFLWKNELITSRGKSETQTVLDEDGIVNLTKLSVPPAEKKYMASFSAIPEVFADILFSQILASEREVINVEFIESSGKITPVTISKIKPEISRPNLSKPAYALEMNFLDDSERSKTIYFDDQGQIIRQILVIPIQGRRLLNVPLEKDVLTLVRSTSENLVAQFPEQAEQILQKISKTDVN